MKTALLPRRCTPILHNRQIRAFVIADTIQKFPIISDEYTKV